MNQPLVENPTTEKANIINRNQQEKLPAEPCVHRLDMNKSALFPNNDAECHVLTYGLTAETLVLVVRSRNSKWIITRDVPVLGQKPVWDSVNLLNINKNKTVTKYGYLNHFDGSLEELLKDQSGNRLSVERLYDNDRFVGFYISKS